MVGQVWTWQWQGRSGRGRVSLDVAELAFATASSGDFTSQKPTRTSVRKHFVTMRGLVPFLSFWDGGMMEWNDET